MVSKPPCTDGCHDATGIGLSPGAKGHGKELRLALAGLEMASETHLSDPEEPPRVNDTIEFATVSS